jgi:hypothetical protein
MMNLRRAAIAATVFVFFVGGQKWFVPDNELDPEGISPRSGPACVRPPFASTNRLVCYRSQGAHPGNGDTTSVFSIG